MNKYLYFIVIALLCNLHRIQPISEDLTSTTNITKFINSVRAQIEKPAFSNLSELLDTVQFLDTFLQTFPDKTLIGTLSKMYPSTHPRVQNLQAVINKAEPIKKELTALAREVIVAIARALEHEYTQILEDIEPFASLETEEQKKAAADYSNELISNYRDIAKKFLADHYQLLKELALRTNTFEQIKPQLARFLRDYLQAWYTDLRNSILDLRTKLAQEKGEAAFINQIIQDTKEEIERFFTQPVPLPIFDEIALEKTGIAKLEEYRKALSSMYPPAIVKEKMASRIRAEIGKARQEFERTYNNHGKCGDVVQELLGDAEYRMLHDNFNHLFVG